MRPMWLVPNAIVYVGVLMEADMKHMFEIEIFCRVIGSGHYLGEEL